MKADLETAPCDNRERLAAAKKLFERMGASESDISIDHYRFVENLSLRKQGDGPDTIILGAHYDKVPKGCGAVDNWSGVVTVAHVYKTLHDSQLNKTLLFVMFGKEEEGLRGSKAMVKSMSEDQMSQVCAMINVDSLGMGAPQVAENLANKKLLWRVKGLAKALNFPFGEAPVPGDSDSSSFLAKKIPAVTIHGLTNDFRKVLHTDNDRAAAANAESLYLNYRLIVELITSLDATDCAVWRESPSAP
ncbi:MAG TPA: M20/M25/M40 family metallo-hydrolase [Acidobacteriota bacterium]